MADSIHGKILHQWSFKEFEHHQHSRSWQVWMTLVLIGGIGLSVWYENIMLAFLLFAFAIILITRELQGPEMMRVYIREGALELILEDHHHQDRLATTVIPWKDIKRYWMLYQPPEIKNIYIRFTSPFRNGLRIPLIDQNPVEIRNTLNRFIDEDLSITEEPFIDLLARRLKL